MSPISDRPAPASSQAGSRPSLPFVTLGEVLRIVAAGFVVLLLHVFVDGGHQVIDRMFWLLVFGAIAFFVGRGCWRWWSVQSPSIAGGGAWMGLAVAAVGWLNVGFATFVYGINEGNFALILIVPFTWLIGIAVSLAGLWAVGLGAVVVSTALRHAVPGRTWIVLAGIASMILNVAHIVRLVGIFSHG